MYELAVARVSLESRDRVSIAGDGAGEGELMVRDMVPTMRWPPAWAAKTSCRRVPSTVTAAGSNLGNGSGGRSAADGTRVSSWFMGVPSRFSGRGSHAFVNFGTKSEEGGRSSFSALSCEPLLCWGGSIVEPRAEFDATHVMARRVVAIFSAARIRVFCSVIGLRTRAFSWRPCTMDHKRAATSCSSV